MLFSGRNKNFVIKISRHYKKQYYSTTRQTDDCIFFFSGRNRQNRAPNRQMTVSFFPVVMYLFFSASPREAWAGSSSPREASDVVPLSVRQSVRKG